MAARWQVWYPTPCSRLLLSEKYQRKDRDVYDASSRRAVQDLSRKLVEFQVQCYCAWLTCAVCVNCVFTDMYKNGFKESIEKRRWTSFALSSSSKSSRTSLTSVGDNVVHCRIVEGNRERIQVFPGRRHPPSWCFLPRDLYRSESSAPWASGAAPIPLPRLTRLSMPAVVTCVAPSCTTSARRLARL